MRRFTSLPPASVAAFAVIAPKRWVVAAATAITLGSLLTSGSATGAFARVVRSGSVPRFTITDIGASGGFESDALGINTNGIVVGESTSKTGHSRAVEWKKGRMVPLVTPGATSSVAWSVNDHGTVAGAATGLYLGEPQESPVRWKGSSRQVLSNEGGSSAFALSISNHGHIAGQINTNLRQQHQNDPVSCFPYACHAFVYDPRKNPSLADLGTLGGDNSSASGVNDAGTVTGSSTLPAEGPYGARFAPFTWTAQRGMKRLPTIGPDGFANAINRNGTVAGWTDLTVADPKDSACGLPPAVPFRRAAVWKNGVLTELPPDKSFPDTAALSVNALGEVVGNATPDYCDVGRAVLWTGSRELQLNNLLPSHSKWNLQIAWAINGSGSIVGQGVNPQGHEHAFLLTPCSATSCT